MRKTIFVASSAVLAMVTNAYAGSPGTTLLVEKTANTTVTRTYSYEWSVVKKFSPDQIDTILVPPGGSYTATFLVDATRTPVQPNPAYSNPQEVGSICVTNTGTVPTIGLQVWDTLYVNGAASGSAVLVPLGGHSALVPGERECYPYTFALSPFDPEAAYGDLAHVTIDNYLGHEGTAFGPTDVLATASFIYTDLYQNNVATLADNIDCNGFTCAIDTPLPTTALTDTTTNIPLIVTITNPTGICDNALHSALNTVSLTPANQPPNALPVQPPVSFALPFNISGGSVCP